MTSHDFSMTLALALIFKYFQGFPCFGGSFWAYLVQQIQTVVSTLQCVSLSTILIYWYNIAK